MALALAKPHSLPHAQERRRHQRVRVDLLGRYMLADRREFPCQVINMSPGGMAVIAPVSGEVGERVIAYVDHLGRLEGIIARLFNNGFAMTIGATRAQTRQACRPAHLARQPQHPQPAGRPQAWPYRAAQPGGTADPAERHRRGGSDHRYLAVGRRHRDAAQARGRQLWSRSARSPAGWCAISKRASRWNSPGSSTRTRWKTTPRYSKRSFPGIAGRGAACHCRSVQRSSSSPSMPMLVVNGAAAMSAHVHTGRGQRA